MKQLLRPLAAAAAITLVIGLAATRPIRADNDKPRQKDLTPIGAWFGIARPSADSTADSPVHEDLCAEVCGACPN